MSWNGIPRLIAFDKEKMHLIYGYSQDRLSQCHQVPSGSTKVAAGHPTEKNRQGMDSLDVQQDTATSHVSQDSEEGT